MQGSQSAWEAGKKWWEQMTVRDQLHPGLDPKCLSASTASGVEYLCKSQSHPHPTPAIPSSVPGEFLGMMERHWRRSSGKDLYHECSQSLGSSLIFPDTNACFFSNLSKQFQLKGNPPPHFLASLY